MAARMSMSPHGRFPKSARIRVYSTMPPDASLYYFDSFWHLLYYSECPKVAHVETKLLKAIKLLEHSSKPYASLTNTGGEQSQFDEFGAVTMLQPPEYSPTHLSSLTTTSTPGITSVVSVSQQLNVSENQALSSNSKSVSPPKRMRVVPKNDFLVSTPRPSRSRSISRPRAHDLCSSSSNAQEVTVVLRGEESVSCPEFNNSGADYYFLDLDIVEIGNQEYYKTCSLWLSGCLIPSFESSRILKDGDTVYVQIVYTPKDSSLEQQVSVSKPIVTIAGNGGDYARSRTISEETGKRKSPQKRRPSNYEPSLNHNQSLTAPSDNKKTHRRSECKGYKCFAPRKESEINLEAGVSGDYSASGAVGGYNETLTPDQGSSAGCCNGNGEGAVRKKSRQKENLRAESEDSRSVKKLTGNKTDFDTPGEHSNFDKSQAAQDTESHLFASECQPQRANLMSPEIQSLLRKKIAQLSKEKERSKKLNPGKGTVASCANLASSFAETKKRLASQPPSTTITNEEIADDVVHPKRRRKRKKKGKSEATETVEPAGQPQAPPNYCLNLPIDQQPQNTRLVFEVSSEEEVENVSNENASLIDLSDYAPTIQYFNNLESHGKENCKNSVPASEKDNESFLDVAQPNDKGATSELNAGTKNIESVSTFMAAAAACITSSPDSSAVTPLSKSKKSISGESLSSVHRRANTIAQRFSASLAEKPQKFTVGAAIDPAGKFEELLGRRRVRSRQGLSGSGDASERSCDEDKLKKLPVEEMEKETYDAASVLLSTDLPKSEKVSQQVENDSKNHHDTRKLLDRSGHLSGDRRIEVTPVGIECEKIPVLEGPPQLGDIVAFKVMELGEDYTPSLSSFKIGRVILYDCLNDNIEIEIDRQEAPKKRTGRFEMTFSDEENEVEEPLISAVYSQLYEVRLVRRGC